MPDQGPIAEQMLKSDEATAMPWAEARRRLTEGAENAAPYLASLDHPSTKMTRIMVRPSWVGVIDFQTRNPSALGGVTG